MWTQEQTFVNDEHQQIYENTKHIPGWQTAGDSNRLYEMGFRAGDVILEIGMFGGRSATVELKGALADPERQSPPQYFGVDIEFNSVMRTLQSLTNEGLQQHALAFHGDLEQFVSQHKIQPTMVFVDGDHRYPGVKKDLEILSSYLVAETPVLCHDYWHPNNENGKLGVRQAVNEFVEDGWARMIGKSGCSALIVTSDQCNASETKRWSEEQFAQTRAEILGRYISRLHQELYRLQTKDKNPAAA